MKPNIAVTYISTFGSCHPIPFLLKIPFLDARHLINLIINFYPFSMTESVLVKILDDNNASALDAALEAAMVFADKGPVTAELTQALAPVRSIDGFFLFR